MSEFPLWPNTIVIVAQWWTVCVWVGGCIAAFVTQLCFIPAARGRKSTASHEISFPANNPSSIYISPKSESAFPPFGRHICSVLLLLQPLLHSSVGNRNSMLLFFPLLTFWWNGLAKDDRQQIPISQGCHAARCLPKIRCPMFNHDPSIEEHLHLSCLLHSFSLSHTHTLPIHRLFTPSLI